MKRGIAAIIILAVCIVFATSVNLTLEHKAQSLHTIAQSALQDKKYVDLFEEEWSRQIIYFELFTDRSYFENINKRIKMLKYLEGELYRNTCAEAVINLIELKEHLSFSLSNIF